MPKIAFASISMIGVPWIDGLKAAVKHQFEAFELNCVYPLVSSFVADRITWDYKGGIRDRQKLDNNRLI